MTGLPASPFAVTLLSTAAALLVMMAVTFAIALKVGKHSVVDTAWGIGIALVALVALVSSIGYGQPARRATLAAASVIWGLRLAIYIGSRNRGKPEDPRYRDLLSRAQGDKNAYALRTIYLLQALILWVACLPIQAGMLERAPAGPVTIIGAALWLGGFAFESVGDWQLARFKADPAHQGMIMDRGLWRYTRHPNYFGDFCMWWGLFLISFGSWVELLTIVGPLLMTFLLTRGSGQRLTERRMADRPQYADYIARTSGFFPRPPRRTNLTRRSGPGNLWSHRHPVPPAPCPTGTLSPPAPLFPPAPPSLPRKSNECNSLPILRRRESFLAGTRVPLSGAWALGPVRRKARNSRGPWCRISGLCCWPGPRCGRERRRRVARVARVAPAAGRSAIP